MADKTIFELTQATPTTGVNIPISTSASIEATKTTPDAIAQLFNTNYFWGNVDPNTHTDSLNKRYGRFGVTTYNIWISGFSVLTLDQGTGYINKIAAGAYTTHTLVGSNSNVIGGSTNNVQGNNSFIGGGVSNTTRNTNSNSIVNGSGNSVSGNYAGIGCGSVNAVSGTNSYVAGGELNTIVNTYGFIGGGTLNYTNKQYATIGGGFSNNASGTDATIGGGIYNTIRNTDGTIGGGAFNDTAGIGGTVPGGRENAASGLYSFAAGLQSKATHQGSFVLSDANAYPKYSFADHSIAMYFSGGTQITGGGGLNVEKSLYIGSGIKVGSSPNSPFFNKILIGNYETGNMLIRRGEATQIVIPVTGAGINNPCFINHMVDVTSDPNVIIGCPTNRPTDCVSVGIYGLTGLASSVLFGLINFKAVVFVSS